MTKRTSVVAVLSLTGLILGCGAQPPTSPTPPTVFVPTVQPTFTVSGFVTETTATGEVPLEGAFVYWSDYKGTRTDAIGSYSISGVAVGGQDIWVQKEGYVYATDPTSPYKLITAAGDTRLNVKMTRKP